MPIRQLAPDVAAKIAAGEVVERPASVVKELIENSIDAGATQIRVDLEHGGLQLIRVTDNGSGIPADELPLALARHATSKVSQIDDLEHIRSLGFRGEALASIAAVAEVTLLSRVRGSEHGAQIGTTNGQIMPVSSAASPEGTAITVRNLFDAVPARRKFLKSRNTEVGHCHHLLEQYALAYPEIRFNVYSEGRQIFATPGNGQLASVLLEVYGLQIAQQMTPISGQDHPDDPTYPVISGYVSRPTCYKSTRQHISFFVNRRWVLSRLLTASVEGAYHSLLLSGRHPLAVVNIQIDPTQLDVNVHPAKTEIRFLKERRVFAAILRAVRQALLEEPEMPQWQPRKQQKQQPESVDIDDPLEDLDETLAASEESAPAAEEAAPAFPRDNPWLTVTEEETGSKPPVISRLWQSHIRPNSSTSQEQLHTLEDMPSAQQEPDPENIMSEPSIQEEPESTTVTIPLGKFGKDQIPIKLEFSMAERVTIPFPVRQEPPMPIDIIPSGGLFDSVEGRRLPRLRVIGQLCQSYIVTEGEQGMYLIDQHAAHERILLERMVVAWKARTPLTQLVLTPILLELVPPELEAIEEHLAQLEQIGFHLEIQDGRTVAVQGVPNVLVKQMNARSLHELLLDLTAPESLGHTETWEERALANVACKAAIKQNYFLTVSEMREMIEQLEQTNAPYSCCHGRPTMVHFSLSSLAHEFDRR